MILQVLPGLGTGGVEKAVTDLIPALRSIAPEIHHGAASSGGDLVRELDTAGIPHFVLPLQRRSPGYIISNARKIAALIRTHDVKLAHVHSRAPAWSVYLAARMTGIPWVATFHGAYGAQNALKRFYNAVMLKADAVISVSPYITRYMTDTYRNKVRHHSLHTITEGIDTRFFDPSLTDPGTADKLRDELLLRSDMPCGRKIILLPARFTKIKGHTHALDAVAQLPCPRPLTVFCGPDHEGDYACSLIREAQKKGVALLCLPPFTDMRPAYAAADVILNISVKPEAFGRTTVEALAMNRPVIGSSHGGTRDILEAVFPEGLTAAGNASDIASKLCRLLHEAPRPAYDLHKVVSDLYSLEHMVTRTAELYRRLLSAR